MDESNSGSKVETSGENQIGETTVLLARLLRPMLEKYIDAVSLQSSQARVPSDTQKQQQLSTLELTTHLHRGLTGALRDVEARLN